MHQAKIRHHNAAGDGNEIDLTLEENSEHVLSGINEALDRIESGTFGSCAGCGKQIAEERLEALPYATRCIDCQRLAERA